LGLLLSDEMRLLYAIGLCAIPYIAGWRLARRFTDDAFHAAGDAFLLFYAVQYVAVCLPGVCGILTPVTIASVALIVSIALLIFPRRPLLPPQTSPLQDRIILTAAPLFVTGYLAAVVHNQCYLPITSNDALTYHMPAAVQWLQTRRLGLYETWFYNPANSYSPLAGSTFIVFLIAPMGNDVLARYVEAAPLLFVFVAMVNLCRLIGTRTATAALISIAAVLARPLASQTILAKDDLFLVAFCLSAIVAFARERQTAVAPWRVSLALGMLFATKYTALFSLPIVLLLFIPPRRIHWVLLIGPVFLAGPWFVRN